MKPQKDELLMFDYFSIIFCAGKKNVIRIRLNKFSHDFPWPENKSHDIPGFSWPVDTLYFYPTR